MDVIFWQLIWECYENGNDIMKKNEILKNSTHPTNVYFYIVIMTEIDHGHGKERVIMKLLKLWFLSNLQSKS